MEKCKHSGKPKGPSAKSEPSLAMARSRRSREEHDAAGNEGAMGGTLEFPIRTKRSSEGMEHEEPAIYNE